MASGILKPGDTVALSGVIDRAGVSTVKVRVLSGFIVGAGRFVSDGDITDIPSSIFETYLKQGKVEAYTERKKGGRE